MNTIKAWVRSISEFLQEVRTEVIKVSFPTRSEVIGSTTVVVVLMFMIALFLALMDTIFMRLFRWVL